jgi:hypothetical protein
MSIPLFKERLGSAQVATNDAKYMPQWLREYAALGPVPVDGNLAIDEDRVLRFLRSLRDRHVPAWQRLQAARALEWYQALVLRSNGVDFSRFKLKLGELAERERRCGGSLEGSIPGEGAAGRMDPNEPAPVVQLRSKMRFGRSY